MVTRDERGRLTLDVGLDLDGCFYDFAAAYYDSCMAMGRLLNPTDPWDGYKPATRWEFYEDHGHDLPTFLGNCDKAADLGLLWAGPVMPGGNVAWRTLVGAGHRVHVKTDRSFGTTPVASEVATRMWLLTNGLRFESITFGADKTQGPAVDVMLDDKLANYDALEQTGAQVWLFDRPWNQDPGDDRRRVYSYDEFLTRVDVLARHRALVGA